MCAIDVQPDATLFARRSDRLQIVERSGRRRPRCGNYRHHALPVVAEAVQGLHKRLNVHFIIARRDGDSAATSHTELSDCAGYRIVRVLSVDHHRRIGADPVFPRIGDRCVPRRQHRSEIGFGTTRRKRAARAAPISGELR